MRSPLLWRARDMRRVDLHFFGALIDFTLEARASLPVFADKYNTAQDADLRRHQNPLTTTRAPLPSPQQGDRFWQPPPS